jgi:hypothetical protein
LQQAGDEPVGTRCRSARLTPIQPIQCIQRQLRLALLQTAPHLGQTTLVVSIPQGGNCLITATQSGGLLQIVPTGQAVTPCDVAISPPEQLLSQLAGQFPGRPKFLQ